jgi:hypothetical protein
MNRRERRAAVKRSPISALIGKARGDFACTDSGERLAVVRPKRPAVALAAAQTALRHQDEAVLKGLPDDDYTFAGWLSADGRRLLDERGACIGALEPGDSLVTFGNDPLTVPSGLRVPR